MKHILITLFGILFYYSSNAQIQHSIYLAPGLNLYQLETYHQGSSYIFNNHRFKTNWQGSVGYRLLYRLKRFAFYGTSEVKYSKIKFTQFQPADNYSGELINAEATIGLSYRVYKKLAIGLDYKQIHELKSKGIFFEQIFELDDDYFGYTLSLQYQFSKHFEAGLHFCAPAGNQYSTTKNWEQLVNFYILKVYLNNLDLRFYYNF